MSNHSNAPRPETPDEPADLGQIESLVRGRLQGMIRQLRVTQAPEGLIIEGIALTYYAKQMAQHSVMTATSHRVAANRIRVDRPARQSATDPG